MNKLWGGILVLACAGAAYGEFSSQDTIRFTTPFAFHLGDKLLPAGEYTIRWQQDFHVLVLKSPAESAMSFALNGVSASGGVSARENASIVFNKYGESSYFLSHVWPGDGALGLQTVKSKKEKVVITTTLTAEAKPQTIMILAARR